MNREMEKTGRQYLEETFAIEAECLQRGAEAVDEEQFMKAVELLARAERIGASGCGHSGIACRHFAHLMCCIERPARFLSPAEAPHGGIGYLKKGDVMLFVSRGGRRRSCFRSWISAGKREST